MSAQLEQRQGGMAGGWLGAHSAVCGFLRRLAGTAYPASTLCLQGIINLGTSENKLCFDLLSWRVSMGAGHHQLQGFLECFAIVVCCMPQ